MRNEELLIRLTQTQGIAGYEKKVRELIEQEVRPYADELIVDPLGSLIAVKKGKGGPRSKKIMFAAHMDEIGFMVKKIEEDGRLLVCNVGWNWTASAYNTRVVFRNGIYGVVSSMKNIEDAHNILMRYLLISVPNPRKMHLNMSMLVLYVAIAANIFHLQMILSAQKHLMIELAAFS